MNCRVNGKRFRYYCAPITLSHLADTVHFENTHACELSVLLFLKYSLKCHTAKLRISKRCSLEKTKV